MKIVTSILAFCYLLLVRRLSITAQVAGGVLIAWLLFALSKNFFS